MVGITGVGGIGHPGDGRDFMQQEGEGAQGGEDAHLLRFVRGSKLEIYAKIQFQNQNQYTWKKCIAVCFTDSPCRRN